MKADADEAQLLEPLKEMKKKMREHIWRMLDCADNKAQLLDWLLEFLNKHLDPESTRKTLYQLYKAALWDLLCTLEPSDFGLFLFQLGITENKYNYKYK